MKFTGEQLVPEKISARLSEEHYLRYSFALSFVKNKMVLDIACGTGYGSKLLSTKAKNVAGVDISKECIAFAKKNYSNGNIMYYAASVDTCLFPEASFDVICSFETIEHLENELRIKYLTNLRRWLRRDGILILSTPNKRVTSPFSIKPLNTFHVLEYTRNGLIDELSPYFRIEEILGQRLTKKYLTRTVIRKIIHAFQRLLKKEFHLYNLAPEPAVRSYNDNNHEPRIFVVICKPIK
jgi:2-polyprenyl-3-methyl-5-hydroxy-6-metoxy-1,4-benzoquinol methylase